MRLIYECPESEIAIGVLVGVVNPNLEEEVVEDSGWYHSKERW